MIDIEVCVDNLESILNADLAGVQRLELCSALSAEGLTPSASLVRFAKNNSNCSLHIMIRLRSGDFYYNQSEQNAMLDDLKALEKIGINGFVIGALDKHNNIDEKFLAPFIEFASKKKLEITFHRAIDLTTDYFDALQRLCDLGFTRVLTSGHRANVEQGVEHIKSIQSQFGGSIQIMPGGGITPDNITRIIQKTNVRHIHCSASQRILRSDSNALDVFGETALSFKVTNLNQLKSIVQKSKELS
ncbi:copper homeostasis protein CutC [Francisellaceae bacterium]|nr:copper homeostasis protein CutC [Francisellaceae bacterium]